MQGIATPLQTALRALARRKQVICRNGNVTDKPLGPKIDRNRPVERSADALEHDLTEALALWLSNRRAAALLPVEPDPIVVGIARPADRNRAGRARQGTVLGRVGGELVHDQAERLHGRRREEYFRSLQDDLRA